MLCSVSNLWGTGPKFLDRFSPYPLYNLKLKPLGTALEIYVVPKHPPRVHFAGAHIPPGGVQVHLTCSPGVQAIRQTFTCAKSRSAPTRAASSPGSRNAGPRARPKNQPGPAAGRRRPASLWRTTARHSSIYHARIIARSNPRPRSTPVRGGVQTTTRS